MLVRFGFVKLLWFCWFGSFKLVELVWFSSFSLVLLVCLLGTSSKRGKRGSMDTLGELFLVVERS